MMILLEEEERKNQDLVSVEYHLVADHQVILIVSLS